MGNRLYRIVALAAGGILCFLNPQPAQAGTATIERGLEAQSQSAVGKEALFTHPSSGSKKTAKRSWEQERRQISEFVALGNLILEDALIPDKGSEARFSSFDPAPVGRILGSHASSWGTAPFPFNRDEVALSDRTIGATNIFSKKIEIQPLIVRKVSPPFEYFGTTVLYNPMALTPDDLYTLSEIQGIESDDVFRGNNGSQESQGTLVTSSVKGSKSPLHYSYKKDNMAVNTGVSWINDMAEARGLFPTLQLPGYERGIDKVPGVNLNLGASYQAFSLKGGYIHALDRYGPTQPALLGNEIESGAWSSELAYTTEVLRKETTLAVGYQKASESLRLYLPEQRYSTKASMAIFDGTTFSLEYYLDKDYPVENGGTNGNGYGIATRIGFDFQLDR